MIRSVEMCSNSERECDICGEDLSELGPGQTHTASDGLSPLCEKCKEIHEYELKKRKDC